MMKEKMTVHEALCELKTLVKRVSDGIEEAMPVAYKEKGSTLINGKPVKDVVENMKSAHQSVTDLIRRMTAIKAAISQYNADTHISVTGKDYTIAQAIYMKDYGIAYQRTLINTYSQRLRSATDYADRQNGDKLNQRAEAAMNAIYGAKEKADPAQYLKGLADYKEQHTVELIDPLDLAKVIETMTAEVDAFENKVDSAIQIANATTEIEIEY